MSAPRLRGEAERCRLCRAPLGTRGLPRTLSRVTSCTQDPVPGQTLCLGSLLWVWRAAAPCWGLLRPACALSAAAPSAPRPRCSRCRWGPRGLPGQPPALTPHLPPGDPAAEEWSQWSVCSLTCGQGSQVRTRSCVSSPYGTLCSGLLRETRTCNNTATCPGTGGHGGGFQGRDGGGGHVGTCACVGVSRWRGKWGCLGARREGGFMRWGQQEPSSSPPILSPPLLWQPSGVRGGRHLQDVPPCPAYLALLLFILIPRGCREPRGFPGEVWSWGRGRGWACAVGLGPGGLVRGRRWPSCSSTVLSRGASRMDACDAGDGHQQCPACLSVCPQRGPCVLCGTAGTGGTSGCSRAAPSRRCWGALHPITRGCSPRCGAAGAISARRASFRTPGNPECFPSELSL